MGEIFISSLKFSWVNPEIFRDENKIFMHENENFAHEMKISGMKFFVREMNAEHEHVTVNLLPPYSTHSTADTWHPTLVPKNSGLEQLLVLYSDQRFY